MTSATIDESSSEPAASAVPSFGDRSQVPDGMMRARAPDSPRALVVRWSKSPTRAEVEPRRAGVDQVQAVGQAGEGPVDGSDLELVGGELDDEGHDQVGPGVIAATLPVGPGGLIAMVAVGQDHRRGVDGFLHGADGARIVDHPELVPDTVAVHRLGLGWIVPCEASGETRCQGEPPDGGEVGPGGAQQLEPVASWPWAGSARGGGSAAALWSSMPRAPMTPLVACPLGEVMR